MIFSVRLLKGLWKPSEHFVYLHRASTLQGFWPRFFCVLMAFSLLGIVQASLGIGTEVLMKEWGATSISKFEKAKIIFGLGILLESMLYPIAFMLIFSTALTMYVDELSFQKMNAIHLYAITLFLMERVLSLAIYYFYGVTSSWNVFSLAPMVHLLTDYPLLLILASKTTIFQLWAFVIQFISLKLNTEVSTSKLVSFLLLLYFFFNSMNAIITALIQELDFVL